MKKWIKRGLAGCILSMAVFGGTASASWCGTPCYTAYNACLANGLPGDVCETKLEICLAGLCPNG